MNKIYSIDLQSKNGKQITLTNFGLSSSEF
jgi:hypothetical protein